MKKISIVIPTINRVKELDCLLDSIEKQKYKELEIIVVDQNKNLDISKVIEKYKKNLNIVQYKVDFKGASKARNYGFKYASGEIISFPDDDSCLEENILQYINNYFEKNNNVDAVFGKVTDKNNKKDILHFKNKDTKVKKINIYQTTIETSMYIKPEVFRKIGMYDELLGVGTIFGAEEGADLVCRLLYEKYNLQYKSKTFCYHANKREEELYERVYSYSIGFGALCYKHIKILKKTYPMLILFLMKIIKNIIYIFWGIVTLNKNKIMYNYSGLKGKFIGIKKRGEI